MAMTASGAVSLNNIQTEFGGTNPISMSEYYRAGALVPSHDGTIGIPSSGTINMSNFYSTSRIWVVAFTITTNQTTFNLRTYLTNTLGKDPASLSVPVYCTVTINSGVTLTGSGATAGFDTGSGWPAGSIVYLTNNGTIAGTSGAAGASGGNGAGGAGGSW